MSEIQPIIDMLQARFPWLATLLITIGTLRIVLKFFSGWLQGLLTSALQRVVDTTEYDDDRLAESILASKIYRVIAFFIDLLTSIKLPTTDSFKKLQSAKADNIAGKVGLWLLAGMLSFGAMTAVTGCQTATTPTTQEARIFYSFRDTWNVARSAYQGYCELAVQGKVTQRDQQDIDRAWNQFRIGFKLALLAAQKDWNATTPDGVAALKTDLITLIRSL